MPLAEGIAKLLSTSQSPTTSLPTGNPPRQDEIQIKSTKTSSNLPPPPPPLLLRLLRLLRPSGTKAGQKHTPQRTKHRWSTGRLHRRNPPPPPADLTTSAAAAPLFHYHAGGARSSWRRKTERERERARGVRSQEH